MAGDSDRVQSLLELGVDINIKTPVCENHYCIYYDHRLTGRDYYQNYVLLTTVMCRTYTICERLLLNQNELVEYMHAHKYVNCMKYAFHHHNCHTLSCLWNSFFKWYTRVFKMGMVSVFPMEVFFGLDM